jgi:hypothetical protein
MKNKVWMGIMISSALLLLGVYSGMHYFIIPVIRDPGLDSLRNSSATDKGDRSIGYPGLAGIAQDSGNGSQFRIENDLLKARKIWKLEVPDR